MQGPKEQCCAAGMEDMILGKLLRPEAASPGLGGDSSFPVQFLETQPTYPPVYPSIHPSIHSTHPSTPGESLSRPKVPKRQHVAAEGQLQRGSIAEPLPDIFAEPRLLQQSLVRAGGRWGREE